MFNILKQKPNEPVTIISKGLKIQGDIETDHSVFISGETISKSIKSKVLIIEKDGVVRCDSIECDSVVIEGTCIGNVNARVIEISETANVTGDLSYKSSINLNTNTYEGKIIKIKDPSIRTKTESKVSGTVA